LAPVIDPKALTEIRRWQAPGGVDPLAELVRLFEEEGADRITQLSSAVRMQNEQLVFRIAHTLKSEAQIFGAHELIALCRDIEERCRSGAIANTRPFIDALPDAFERALAELRVALDEWKPA
jgi:HPt (histidine-containing phosphotransfer) domain-containing protein